MAMKTTTLELGRRVSRSGTLKLGVLLAAAVGCKASVQAEAKVGTDSNGAPLEDFDRPLEAPPLRVEPVSDSFSVEEYALLGARHDLNYAGPAEPICRCLAVSLQDRPTHASFQWQLATPRLEPTTQWVIAFTSNDVQCQDAPEGTLGASYQGYEVDGDDVVVHVEALGEGRPMTSGAVIPKPHPGGSVFVESAGAVYGKPLNGRGKRCQIAPPGPR
jgi:hypothetical protein